MSGTLITPERKSRSFSRHSGVIDVNLIFQLHRVQAMFKNIPTDPYVDDDMRCKSIGRVFIEPVGLTLAPHRFLFQDSETNPVHGDMHRDYPMMPIELILELAPVIQYFGAIANLNSHHEILAQAQRVSTASGDDGKTGFPVVERWHRDAVDVLGILVVAQQNISGGINLLSRDMATIDEAVCLAPGEMMFIEDGAWFHDVSPIRPLGEAYVGVRDIVILTSPSSRPPA